MKFLIGLLLGLGLGVALGLLVAPQSGEDTRNQLGEQGIMLRAGNINGEIRARAQDALSQGRELYARTKTDLTDRYNKAKTGEL
jgi:gas vesicle protein